MNKRNLESIQIVLITVNQVDCLGEWPGSSLVTRRSDFRREVYIGLNAVFSEIVRIDVVKHR